MSVKVDVDKSTKARTEGNASFKKGRWTEAIGHYTTAIVFNPQDGLGYTNRAAAYLKIEKWKDAERDCTTALELASQQPNVKALYRRALARKALDDLDGAMQDIEAVLQREASNETAKEEREELQELLQKRSAEREAKRRIPKALPPSPPRATITELPPDEPLEPPAQISHATTENPDTTPRDTTSLTNTGMAGKSSFADMRKNRQTGRKTFASPISAGSDSDGLVPSIPAAASPPSKSFESIRLTEPPPKPNTAHNPPLPLLDPLAPGSALAFISSIRRHPAHLTFPVISDLATRPAAVGKMFDDLLEPDQLALILRRLDETLELKLATDDERRRAVRGFMSGMTVTRRWVMTAIMLSRSERELGQRIWEKAGGEGDWTKRQNV